MNDLLQRSIADLAQQHTVQLLELSIAGSDVDPELKVIVDSPEGVTIGAISKLSKAIRRSDAVENYFETDRFRLEVSSPGIGYGLKHPWQFPRLVGKKLKVHPNSGGASDAEMSPVQGRLLEATETSIVLDTESGEIKFDLNEIDQALVMTDW